MPAAGISSPMVVAGRTILEPGAPVVWFTFPGRAHDIGRFHAAGGTFTGYYANVLTPVELDAAPPPPGTLNDAELAAAARGRHATGAVDGLPIEPAERSAPNPPDEGDVWLTTDLFLDVFLDLTGEVHVLDRDELDEAMARGWVDAATGRRAELEANRLVEAARTGEWPPAIVEEWTLEKVVERIQAS